MSDKQTHKRQKTKLTAPLLAHHIKDAALCLLISTLHLHVCTGHMAWEELTVGVEVDSSYRIYLRVYLLGKTSFKTLNRRVS